MSNTVMIPRNILSAAKNTSGVVADTARDTFTFAMVQRGPAVNANEVELPTVEVTEIVISWGTTVLSTAHVASSKGYWVGESEGTLTADFILPVEKIGVTRLPLIVADSSAEQSPDAAQSWVVIPALATGYIKRATGKEPLETARSRGLAVSELVGAVKLPLALGESAVFELGGFTFRVARVSAGKAIPRAILQRIDKAVASYFGVAALTVAGFIGALAYTQPAFGLMADDGIDKEQALIMMQFLSASAEKNAVAEPADVTSEPGTPSSLGQQGERAKGSEGKMGKTTTTVTNKRFSVAGDAPTTVLSRAAQLEAARTGGMIGILNSGSEGRNIPTAPWSDLPAAGTGSADAQGNMWGDSIGDASGTGGLGLSGVGEGGGVYGPGVGIHRIGTVGGGSGTCTGDHCEGMGRHSGRLGGGHAVRGVSVRPDGKSMVSGRLPPEIIQRTVRQNYGRFRMCYEQGLGRNPNLEGRVAVRFVIDATGRVSAASGGGDLPDSAVTSCVTRAFYSLSFPAPENGVVTVSYPIMFSPG